MTKTHSSNQQSEISEWNLSTEQDLSGLEQGNVISFVIKSINKRYYW